MAEKLDAELKELQAKYQTLQDELNAERATLAEFKEKDAYLEEKVGVLKGLLEQENEEKEELNKELAETKKHLEEEQSKNKQLTSDKQALEGKVSSLEGQVSSLVSQLENERNARKKLEDEYAARSKVQVNGLGVMKVKKKKETKTFPILFCLNRKIWKNMSKIYIDGRNISIFKEMSISREQFVHKFFWTSTSHSLMNNFLTYQRN